MNKSILVVCSMLFLACTNQSAESENKAADSASNRETPPVTRLSEESEREILAGCIDNANPDLGDAKAYALCKCVLAQVQQKYPGADSTALIGHLNDTTQVKQMVEECR